MHRACCIPVFVQFVGVLEHISCSTQHPRGVHPVRRAGWTAAHLAACCCCASLCLGVFGQGWLVHC